ncbi:MAG TPA: hypothetical protein DCW68_07300 [Rhodospirillaceae bacterium]|nr:hypothetical protein [Rhodospirillaceae bacterium]
MQEIGSFEVPDSLVGNSNETARQMLALACREGDVLARRCPWSALVRRFDITTVAGQDFYAAPEDVRSYLDGTWLDETHKWPLVGPALPREWQALRAHDALARSHRMFRIEGAGIRLLPVPAVSGERISLEYVSSHWCVAQDGTRRARFAADTDAPMLDPFLLRMGVKFRFLKEKGLPWEADYAEYDRELRGAVARDGAAPSLLMGGGTCAGPALPGLPDSGFGG